MRANTRRDHRLAFDDVATAYDDGRPRFSDNLVRSIAEVCRLQPGDEVVELGAGTGQLTAALLAFGLVVTAIEPGSKMRTVLANRFGSTGRLEVEGTDFEDFTSDTTYQVVLAANSFHWLDPARSYHRAADLLAEGGHLSLIWNYPIVRADIQVRLNDTVFLQHPDFAGNEVTLLGAVQDSAEDGRRQLLASGRFEPPWWQWREEHLELSVERYTRLLISYANVAALDEAARAALAANVNRELAAAGTDRVEMTNHIYTVVAKKA